MSQVSQVTIPALPIGNLMAVSNMVHKVGGAAVITANPEDLYRAQRIIIAGVGSFDAGMKALEEGGWLQPLHAIAKQGQKPILGICLGMQLMCQGSAEGVLSGLGWFDATVERINPPLDLGFKVPHMGWNTLNICKANNLLLTAPEEQRFYFVHSYHVVCDDAVNVIATTPYGSEMTAVIGRDNLYGVQFHPEKSHRFGMALMKKFLEL